MSDLLQGIADFLTIPAVYTVLLLIGTVGIVFEMLFLKKGLFALIGFAAFGLYFFGQFAEGYATYGDIVLFGVGIVLLLLELVVVSFGILGVAAGICIYASVVQAAGDPAEARLAIAVVIVLSILIVGIVLKYFRKHITWKRFVLRDRMTSEEGYVSSPDQAFRLGQHGTAITPLRPAGTAVIGEERVDVVTQGEFIDAGSAVEVVQVEGVRVVVREIDRLR